MVKYCCGTDEKKPLAKLAKDTSAGAVLISVITAVVIGTMMFFPKIMDLLNFNFW